MVDKNLISNLEEELYILLGQIEYGEVSDIEVYWGGVIESLLQLDITGWTKPEYFQTVSHILRSLGENVDDKLISITSEMEELCIGGGSEGVIDPEDIDHLQNLSIEFERLFLFFIEEL